MSEPVILLERDDNHVATVTLNRPEVNNAYDRNVIESVAGGLGQRWRKTVICARSF